MTDKIEFVAVLSGVRSTTHLLGSDVDITLSPATMAPQSLLLALSPLAARALSSSRVVKVTIETAEAPDAER